MIAKIFAMAFLAASFSMPAYAGFGGMANVRDSYDDGPIDFSVIPFMLIGAGVGYFVERAYRKRLMDKTGSRYSDEYLGGKTGAIVGAIALPVIFGLLR